MMLYLPSALSKVTTLSLCATNDCCLLVSRTMPVSLSLKRAPVGARRSRPSVAVVSGCRFPLSCRVDSRLVTMSQSL